MPSKTRPYREALLEGLSDPETAASYLTAAMSDSPETFCKALRNVAQSRQMAKVARNAGVTRESLYRATSDMGNPTLDTLESVLSALDIRIKFEANDPLSPTPMAEVPTNRTHTSQRIEIGNQSSGAGTTFLLLAPAGVTTLRSNILGAGWGQGASTTASALRLRYLNSGRPLNSDFVLNADTANPGLFSTQAELQNAVG